MENMKGVSMVSVLITVALIGVFAAPGSAQGPPAPGQQVTVRNAPPGWVPGGTPSADPVKLYREAMAAYNRYTHAMAQHSPNSPALQRMAQEYIRALEDYYIRGLGLVRATPPKQPTVASPPSTSTTGGGSQAVLGPIPFSDRLQVTWRCAQPLEVQLSQIFSGWAGAASQIEVVVHGFVTDHQGNPVKGATVRLAGVGIQTVTDARGHYQLVFKHQGYVDVDIPQDLQLDPCCLWVDPAQVSLGPVPPGGSATTRVSLVNTCDRLEIDVSFPRHSGTGKVVEAEIFDCSAGYQGTGVAYGTGGTLITMGPGSRCWIDLTFQPPAPGSSTTQIEFTGSDCPKCPVTVTATGAAAQMLRLGSNKVEFPGVVQRFMPTTRRLAVSNASPHSPLTITSVRIEGPDGGDFLARIDSVSQGQVGAAANSASLVPGATASVAIDMVAGTAGAKQATLVLETSDPNAPQVRVPITALVQ